MQDGHVTYTQCARDLPPVLISNMPQPQRLVMSRVKHSKRQPSNE